MAKRLSLSQMKRLAHTFVKDELLLKATDGMKTAASRFPRKEPLLISIEKPLNEDSVSPSKALRAEMDKMRWEEDRVAVTIPAEEFLSKVTSGFYRVVDSASKEVEINQKYVKRMKYYWGKMVERAARQGRDVTMVSWNQELIDIIHKLEDIEVNDGSAIDSKESEDLKKVCLMIYNHVIAHVEMVLKKLEADDDKAAGN